MLGLYQKKERKEFIMQKTSELNQALLQAMQSYFDEDYDVLGTPDYLIQRLNDDLESSFNSEQIASVLQIIQPALMRRPNHADIFISKNEKEPILTAIEQYLNAQPSVLFKRVEILIAYLQTKRQHLSAIRLHKSLYFLFAYYGATYGKINIENSESDKTYPTMLFDETFEAWEYGPVISRFVGQIIRPFDETTTLIALQKEYPEVFAFIDEILVELDELYDWALIDRSRQDIVWKLAKQTTDRQMQWLDIIDEYESMFVQEERVKEQWGYQIIKNTNQQNTLNNVQKNVLV